MEIIWNIISKCCQQVETVSLNMFELLTSYLALLNMMESLVLVVSRWDYLGLSSYNLFFLCRVT